MSNERDKIERGIADLTRSRARCAPDFEALLNRRLRPKRSPRAVLGWLGAAAAIVLGLSLWLALPNPEEEQQAMLAQLEIVSDWYAATDVFLPPLEHRWLGEVPPLGRTDLTIYTGTEQ